MGRISKATSTRKLSRVILAWLFITPLVFWQSHGLSQPLSDVSYDAYFNRFGTRFLAHVPRSPAWLKAQARQESALDPSAVSHAGARGLMQTMPRTHAEISRQLGVECSAFDPRCSIMFGAYYDSRMYRPWDRRERQVNDILPLMFASYNCGLGCVLGAQERCNDGRLFADINSCLPEETRNYVPKIRNYYLEMTCSEE